MKIQNQTEALAIINSDDSFMDALDATDGIDAGDPYGMQSIDQAALTSMKTKVKTYNERVAEELGITEEDIENV